MELFSVILIVLGLCLFEIINSIDNAIINAQVLSTMRKTSRRWFLLWGMLFAVFVIRGLLPWIIVWMSVPSLGPMGAFTATFSENISILHSIELSSPILLVGAGMFLLFLFLHWAFFEVRDPEYHRQSFFSRRRVLFFILTIIILISVTLLSYKIHPKIFLGAIIGFVIFIITNTVKRNADSHRGKLLEKRRSDVNKIFYLEVLDASFSMDGVLGAFAFTLSVPLIILGNGLGALVVRQFTVKNINTIKKYVYLKKGAMFSILCLSIIMLSDSFGANVPSWLSPVVTFIIVGYFFYRSKRHLQSGNNKKVKKKR